MADIPSSSWPSFATTVFWARLRAVVVVAVVAAVGVETIPSPPLARACGESRSSTLAPTAAPPAVTESTRLRWSFEGSLALLLLAREPAGRALASLGDACWVEPDAMGKDELAGREGDADAVRPEARCSLSSQERRCQL